MTDAEPADTRLARILHGYAPAQIAHVMARLRLADLLADGPMTVEDLAAAARARRTRCGGWRGAWPDSDWSRSTARTGSR